MTGRLSAGVYDRGVLGLVEAIIVGSADLRGPHCVEFVGEFDVDRRAEDLGYSGETERWQMVQGVCRACPARGRCWAWASGLGSSAVSGATAASVGNPVSGARRWDRRKVEAAEVQERTDAAAAEAATPTGRSWNSGRTKPLRRRRRRA